jgi:photosystem II stability/assembly factor-like uncharacterized protein
MATPTAFKKASVLFAAGLMVVFWLCTSVRAQDTTPLLNVQRLGERSFFGLQVLLRCDSSYIALTSERVFTTQDDGATWTEPSVPLTNKSVVDILPRGDTLYALTANGALSISTNHGLSWTQIRRYGPGSASRIRISEDTVEAWDQYRAELATIHNKTTFAVRDSTLFISTPYGVNYSLTSTSFTESSSITANDSLVVIGRKRLPVVQVKLNTDALEEFNMPQMPPEYVSAVQLHEGYLYAGTVSQEGVLYRRSTSSGVWEQISINRNLEPIDVRRIVASDRGLYIGLREHGLAFLPSGQQVAYPLHDGLGGAIPQAADEYRGGVVLSTLTRGLVYVKGCGTDVVPFTTTLPYSGDYVLAVVDTTVVVGLQEGILLRSSNTGHSWETLSLKLPYASINRLRSTDSVLWVCTTEGVWKSADRGTIWQRAFTELRSQSIQDVYRLAGGWLVRAQDNSYLCSDSGSYSVFSPEGTFDHRPHILDVDVSRGIIFAAGYPGIFVSKDSGSTWRVFSIPDNQTLRFIRVFGSRVFFTGVRGQIFYVDVTDLL